MLNFVDYDETTPDTWPYVGAPRKSVHKSRRRIAALITIVAIVPTLNSAAGQSADESDAWLVSMIESAALHRVRFSDEQSAWAVGDRGAILVTRDRGQNWQLVSPGITSKSLRSLSFADSQHGTIVGGSAQPFGLPTEGVVLRTTDGGTQWTVVDQTLLPQLRAVYQQDRRTILAAGDASALFVSGLFRCVDGGRSWNGVPVQNAEDWSTADFQNPDTWLLASQSGHIARCAGNRILAPSPQDTGRLTSVRGVAWMDAQHAIAVGDKGLVAVSDDGGRSWQPHAQFMSSTAARQIDFRAIFAREGMVWIAGSPGTVILRSTDAGRTWTAAQTQQSLPINSLDFVNPTHGIAVGEMGLTLVTEDGGTTWTVTRGGTRRAGAMLVCQDDQSIPWELVIQLASVDQLRTHVVVCAGTDSQVKLARAAAQVAGADGLNGLLQHSASWDPRGTRIADDDESILPAAVHDVPRDSTNLIDSYRARVTDLAQQIAIYRPSILIIAGHGEPEDASLESAAIDAIHLAATPPESELPSAFNLPPWKVERVFRSSPRAAYGSLVVDSAQPVPAFRGSIASIAAIVHGYTPHEHLCCWGSSMKPVSDEELAFDPITQRVWPDAPQAGSWWSGLDLPFGGDARRDALDMMADSDGLSRKSFTFHSAQALIERMLLTGDGVSQLDQIAPLTRDLPPAEQSQLLMWAACRCQQSGRAAIARDILLLLMKRQTEPHLEQAVLMQHARYALSREVQQLDKQRGVPAAAQEIMPDPGARLLAAYDTEFSTEGNALVAANAGLPGRSETMESVDSILKKLSPTVQAIPWLQMAAAAKRRDAATTADRPRIYRLVQNKVGGVDWRRCVATEIWLAELQPDPKRPTPPFVVDVSLAATPPILDGVLDDTMWRNVQPLLLTSSNGEHTPQTTVKLAADGRFLFVAIQCERPQNHVAEVDQGSADEYRSTVAPRTGAQDTGPLNPQRPHEEPAARQRDSDLQGFDRIEIHLDTNRDYASGWAIAIDCRGWANESCDGDPSWNPKWHLATKSDNRFWTVEAAIPLAELAEISHMQDRSTATWLLGLRRIVPDQAPLIWPPGTTTSLAWQRCGYLVMVPASPAMAAAESRPAESRKAEPRQAEDR